jgi:hypothetical protein
MENHFAFPRPAILLLASVALAALTAAPAKAQPYYADLFNEWDIPTLDPATNSFGPTGMQFVYQGNATGCIPAQVTADALINPWYANQIWVAGNPHAHHTSITYDSGLNETFVTLSGGALPVPAPHDTGHGGTFPGPTWGNASGQTSYHVGEDEGYEAECPNNPLTNKRWVWNKHHIIQYGNIPFVDTSWEGQTNKENIKLAQAAVLYVETIKPDTGTWHWITYVPPQDGTAPVFLLTNNGTDPLTLGPAGIQTGLRQPTDPKCLRTPKCKENEANLDRLNNTYYPVPQLPGSPLAPLPQLNGMTLLPGQSVEISPP